MGEFTAERKTNADDVTVQDATSTNVQIPLNQHIHTSFLIKDGEASMAMEDLIETFIKPAMTAQSRFIDQVLLGQVYQFLPNVYGRLGQLSSSNVVDYITGIRGVMNNNKAYMMDRNMILTPNAETTFLRTELFTSAEKVGDNGTALREASIGRKFGFNNFMCQNMSSIATGNTTKAGAINNAAGYPVGTVTVTVDGFTGAVTTGSWMTIAGDDQPLRITAHTETSSNTTAITFTPALKAAVVDNAVVTAYTPGAVNNASGYAAGYAKGIAVDAFTVAPKVGQLLSFGTATNVYSVMSASTTEVKLDRPLDAAIVDDAVVGIGPPGEYNFGFHRNALALVSRPLALPRRSTGALAAVVNVNGLSMRVVITYEGMKQGHLVTLDMLAGVAVLDTDLGGVMLG